MIGSHWWLCQSIHISLYTIEPQYDNSRRQSVDSYRISAGVAAKKGSVGKDSWALWCRSDRQEERANDRFSYGRILRRLRRLASLGMIITSGAVTISFVYLAMTVCNVSLAALYFNRPAKCKTKTEDGVGKGSGTVRAPGGDD